MLLSFGGSVQAMITALKNNKMLLKHRHPFRRWKKAVEEAPTSRILPDKKATPEQLNRIQAKYARIHRTNRVLGLLALLATGLIIYFIFELF